MTGQGLKGISSCLFLPPAAGDLIIVGEGSPSYQPTKEAENRSGNWAPHIGDNHVEERPSPVDGSIASRIGPEPH